MQTLKLPVEMPDHIEQYIRSDFLLEYPDWISMWSPSQGCKAEPVPIPRRSVGLGDVGYFDKTGRFEILFNIYLSRETKTTSPFFRPAAIHTLPLFSEIARSEGKGKQNKGCWCILFATRLRLSSNRCILVLVMVNGTVYFRRRKPV